MMYVWDIYHMSYFTMSLEFYIYIALIILNSNIILRTTGYKTFGVFFFFLN